ncbi:MAG: hypothetical protein AABW73_01870 [Nanoarchaeota archaeon]
MVRKAIIMGINLGRMLVNGIPEMVTAFKGIDDPKRGPLSYKEMVQKYKVKEFLKIGDEGIVESAVRYAMIGYNGRCSENYEGQIPKERVGYWINKREMFISSRKAKEQNGTGNSLVERLSTKELRNNGRAGLIQRGRKPAVERIETEYMTFIKDRKETEYMTILGEYDTIWQLINNNDYKIKEGRTAGKINPEKVRMKINELFHEGKDERSYYGINCMIGRVRRKHRIIKTKTRAIAA